MPSQGVSIDDLDTAVRLLVPTDSNDGSPTTWTETSTLWIGLTSQSGGDLPIRGLPPRSLDLATAVARDNPALIRGVRLQVGTEPPWQVMSVQHRWPQRGYVTLSLEREA